MTPTLTSGAPTDIIGQNPDLLATPDPTLDQEWKDLMDFPTVKSRLTNLISKHKQTVGTAIDENRRHRFIDVNVNLERYKDRLKASDLLVLIRTIDTNINREKPPFLTYLKQPDRVATFTQISDPTVNTTDIESEFSRGVTYAGWETPFTKAQDGGATHGWGFVEVVFDETKPFHVAVEHIETHRLIFHEDTTDIQNQEIIIREVPVVPKTLKSWVKKYGFNQYEVDELTKDLVNENKDKTIYIYKKWCKYGGIVYISWFSDKCKDWLKAPEKLYLGKDTLVTSTQMIDTPQVGYDGTLQIVPMPQQTSELQPTDETDYPVFTYEYEVTELPKIIDKKGRVFKDKYKQEAITANLSAFCSGNLLASELHLSPKQPTEGTSKLEGIEIKHGLVSKVPIDYNSAPYPDATMLSLAEYLEAFNAEDAGRPSYAVQQKSSGSRVTAEQIKSARQDQVQLTSLQVSSFSTFMRGVLSFMWKIVQNRALNDKISFLQIVDQMTGELTNDKARIGLEYDVRAAGDTDVIRKNELLSLYQEFWPIMAASPAAPTYLAKMLKLAFGKEGQDFISIIESGDPRVVLLAILDILKATLDPDEMPQDLQGMQQFHQLIMQAEQIVAPLREQMMKVQMQNGEQGDNNGSAPKGRPASTDMMNDNSMNNSMNEEMMPMHEQMMGGGNGMMGGMM